MSNRHRIKYLESSHALTTDLDVGLGVPTAATVTCKDHSGNVLLNGTLDSATGVLDEVTFAYTGHAVAVGDVVTIAGTTNYNGAKTVAAIGAGAFTVGSTTWGVSETGTYTITAAKATALTATTLGAAATRGKGTIQLASVTDLVEGYPLRIAMSADGKSEDVIIASVNSSTKVCGLTDRLKFSHTTGAAVTGRRLSYSLDASQSDFTSGLDFNVIWDLTNTDDPAWREDAEVLKRSVAIGGLEQKFRTLYPHYYAQIPDGEFDVYQETAFDELRMLFEWKAQRDIDKLVNPDEIEPVLLRQIAYNIAAAGDDSWEKEQLIMRMERDDWLTRMSQARIWIDSNQDDIETDDEVQSMDRPLPRRQL